MKASVFSHVILVSRQAHPLGRFCFALGLFAAVLLINRDVPFLLAALGCIVLLLQQTCASWQPLLRAARLLLWLLLPILLLHLLFTPGQLLWPGSGIPLTREGLYEGCWLALRLCTLFYAGMLLSRSLRREEWAFYSLSLPYIGSRLLPYVKLASPMRALVSSCMAEARQQMHASGGVRNLPKMLQALTTLIVRVWHGTASEAESVWHNWDECAPARHAQGGMTSGLLLALGGLLIPLAVWMG
ncbi:MAG: hypothetical protein COW19_01270 [Zetaproteobacteria bacterium CG12_big_fil_rev_8_21_14_0_65_55_1124]|nr:MAG: hypothetical protein AUJ58_08860 [Zetaproteobacteria bacterium CG1_02_55_237]PIS20501.1 MAG: hypothetical protein COT53_00315 [Zetaproteobacteria bacterium CG08_land_8_20_14_0_20_55_17]PIW43779.1 MAG: hypothetical protein COW19_01270 [Zetaproteobacteria bacterium CG12_big_fil_rev_8_21_14_0_65_55_1124]PIY53314.1 MAG: hypothetical protein COZ01_04470 [Zetaproteobacteria bacterium CG_4_10_14_0_8_um_filter_55_43]PIZ40113.1 MAG: hypothetical protein COY36_00505 [Zetaproteobacteria bacterium 